jgi:hypothetical protein
MSDRFREIARVINKAKNAAMMAKLINPVSNGIGRGERNEMSRDRIRSSVNIGVMNPIRSNGSNVMSCSTIGAPITMSAGAMVFRMVHPNN